MDAMLLYSETPNLHTHTLKVAVINAAEYDGDYTFDVFRRTIARRLHLLDPLRYRLVDIPWKMHHPMWMENCEVDLDYHVRSYRVDSPGGRRQLDEAVGRIASTPLARDKPLWEMYFIEGLAGGRIAVLGKIHHALADVDRRLTVRRFAPMSDQIAGSFRLERLIATLTAVFGGVALLLACLGLYGVTAYAVTRRTREIGIRMAIGATRPRVLQTILSGALVQLALGIALGLPLAFLAGRLLQSQLYGVGGHDVRVMAAALALLATAALAAAWIPARRAATVDPVRALRQD